MRFLIKYQEAYAFESKIGLFSDIRGAILGTENYCNRFYLM